METHPPSPFSGYGDMAELLTQIFALSNQEQIRIALAILQHLEQQGEDAFPLSVEQLAQVEATFQQIDSGQMKTHSLEAVKERLMEMC